MVRLHASPTASTLLFGVPFAALPLNIQLITHLNRRSVEVFFDLCSSDNQGRFPNAMLASWSHRQDRSPVRRDVFLCPDCTLAAANGDYSGLDYSLNEREAELRQQEISDGLCDLGSSLCYAGGEEEESFFSNAPCDCCNGLPGMRDRFSVEEPWLAFPLTLAQQQRLERNDGGY